MTPRLSLGATAIIAALLALFVPHHHDAHLSVAATTGRVSTADIVSPTPIVLPKPRPTPVRASRTRTVVVKKKPKVVRKPHLAAGCTSSNWLSTLGADERWIDRHESGLDPSRADVNPSSGAQGLGQLLPSTLRGLGLSPSFDPCDEIHAQRLYMKGRYGSWANARAFWESHRWW